MSRDGGGRPGSHRVFRGGSLRAASADLLEADTSVHRLQLEERAASAEGTLEPSLPELALHRQGEVGVDVALADMFRSPTIVELSTLVSNAMLSGMDEAELSD